MESLSRTVGRLPDRWRRALWLTEVEGREPDEVARLLGVDEAAAAAALARRAREGLRLAYLMSRLRPGTPVECRRTVDRLPAYVRMALPAAVAEQVMDHLEGCAFCRARSGEFAELTDDLGAPLRPVLLAGEIGRPASEPASEPTTEPPAEPASARLSSARLSSGRPASAQPSSEQPAAADSVPARPGSAPDRPVKVPASRWVGVRIGRGIGLGDPRRKHPVAAACVAIGLVAVGAVAAVGLRPAPTSSRESSPPPAPPAPAAVGVPSAPAGQNGSPPSARPPMAAPRVETTQPGSARPNDRRRPGQLARVSPSWPPTAPRGGGTPPASGTTPTPKPTTPPSSASPEFCVGVLVVRLCPVGG